MFTYNHNNINQLEKTISPDRLSTYLIESQNNHELALKLYLWNSKISAAFYIPLQGLEVTLRNALHQELSKKFQTPFWYDVAPLDAQSKENITDAKSKINKSHKSIDPPHVVAELSFGFWVSLLNKAYHQTLWIPALGKAFPNAGLPRSEIHSTLNHIRILRNRIAHHEPIFKRHLEKDYKSIIEFIEWINPVTAEWIDKNNDVLDILNKSP
jgi:abortive infection bacteriophage resistance protein